MASANCSGTTHERRKQGETDDLDARFMEELYKQRASNSDGWDSYLELLRETLENNKSSSEDDDDESDDEFAKFHANIFTSSEINQPSECRDLNTESKTNKGNSDSSTKPSHKKPKRIDKQSESDDEKRRHFFRNGTCYFGIPPSEVHVNETKTSKEQQNTKQTDSKLDPSELQFYKNLRAYFGTANELSSKKASSRRNPETAPINSSPLSKKEYRSPSKNRKEERIPFRTSCEEEFQENGIGTNTEFKVDFQEVQTTFSSQNEMEKSDLNEKMEDTSPRKDKMTKNAAENGFHFKGQKGIRVESPLGAQTKMKKNEMQDTGEMNNENGHHCKQSYSTSPKSSTPSVSSVPEKESSLYDCTANNEKVEEKENDKPTWTSKQPSWESKSQSEKESTQSKVHATASETKTPSSLKSDKNETEKSCSESSSQEQNASSLSDERKQANVNHVNTSSQTDKEFKFPNGREHIHRKSSLENEDSFSHGQTERPRKKKSHKVSEESVEHSRRPSKFHKNKKQKPKVFTDISKESEKMCGKIKSNRISKEEMIIRISANESLDSLVGRLLRSGKEIGISCVIGLGWILWYFLMVQTVLVMLSSLCLYTVSKNVLLACYEHLMSTRFAVFFREKLWTVKLHILRWYGILSNFVREKWYGPKRQAQTYNLPNTADEAVQQLLMRQGPDENPYRILGVPKEATDEDIRKQYRRLAVLVHPDKNKDQDAPKAFQILSSAYDILGDTEKRQQYDREAARKQQSNQGFNKSPADYKDPHDFFADLMKQMEEIRESLSCDACQSRHRRKPTDRTISDARYCAKCDTMHSAKEGDFWKEVRGLLGLGPSKFYTCMQGSIYDITEWGVCQERCGFNLPANVHKVVGKISSRPQQQHRPPPRFREEDFLRDLFGGFGQGHNQRGDNSKPKRRRRKRR